MRFGFGHRWVALGLMWTGVALPGCLPVPVMSSCPLECAQGERRCDLEGSGALEECRQASDGCLAFEVVDECPETPGFTCSDSAEGAECVRVECGPGRCVPGVRLGCVSEGSVRLCQDDELDERGCGVDRVVACEGGETCQAGECVESASCPDVGVECSPGERECTADGKLLECMLYTLEAGRACARFEVLADCVELGGVCNDAMASCQVATCDQENARRCGDAGPEECVLSAGVLKWTSLGQCSTSQTCEAGECVCVGDVCTDRDEVVCASDRAGVRECVSRDGCLVYEDSACASGLVCVPKLDDFAECGCPVVDEAVAPLASEGCDPNVSRWSCDRDGNTLECVETPVGCFVWQLNTVCMGGSGGFACRSSGELLSCSPLGMTSEQSCLRPTTIECMTPSLCMDMGDGTAECSM